MAESKTDKAVSSYNYGLVVSPMAGPNQECDVYLGEFLRRAAFWRYTTVILLGVSIFLAFFLILSVFNNAPIVNFAGIEAHGDRVIVLGKLQKVDSFPNTIHLDQMKRVLKKELSVNRIVMPTK